MARPTSFTETVQLAKQAEANHAKTRTTQPFFFKQQTSQPNTFSQPKPNAYNYTKTPFPNPANRNPNPSQTVSRQRTLTSNEIMERRRKGLCFHCDEKYGNGHVCKMKLYMLSGEGEERENNNEDMSEEVGEGDTEVTEEDCHISIQAISGVMSHSTKYH